MYGREGGSPFNRVHVSKGGPFGFTFTPNVTRAPFRRWNGTIVNAGPLGLILEEVKGGLVWSGDLAVSWSYGYNLFDVGRFRV